MAKCRQIETRIAGEKREIPLPAQYDDDLVILHSLAANIHSDLLCRYPRRFQQQSLAIENVLVEDDQASARWGTYSGAAYWAE